MRYYEVAKNYGFDIMLEGQSTQPLLIAQFSVKHGSGIVIVSYLNELVKTQDNLKNVLLRLLRASLDGRDQNRVQDEVARMLGFPGIDGFIMENYRASRRFEKLCPGVPLNGKPQCGLITCSCHGVD